MSLVFRRFLSRRLIEQARTAAEKGHLGQMEGHAEMDMSVAADGRSVWQRVRSPEGFTATADYFSWTGRRSAASVRRSADRGCTRRLGA